MRKKRIVLRVLLVSAILCVLLAISPVIEGRIPEHYRWLVDPISRLGHGLASCLIIMWIAMRYTPGDKLLLDREEAAILRQGLGGIPWWFVFSVMAVIGFAIWIATWASWWGGEVYKIQ